MGSFSSMLFPVTSKSHKRFASARQGKSLIILSERGEFEVLIGSPSSVILTTSTFVLTATTRFSGPGARKTEERFFLRKGDVTMTEWSEHFVQVNGLTIHYHRAGDTAKPAIILLHGVMDNGLCWTPVARDLQADFVVYMLDARGHGRTGGSLENLSYSVLAEDVAAFIEALDLQKPYVFGHSRGAMTAAVLAAQVPERVRAIVLEDPPFRDEPQAEKRDDELAPGFQQTLQWILNLRALSPEERLVVARKDNPNWGEAELAPWADSKVEFNPEVFHHWQANIPWREVLARIACPVLLVTGDPEAGAIVTPNIAQEASSLWHNGEVAYIQGAGHCIHRDRYNEAMASVQAFLRHA